MTVVRIVSEPGRLGEEQRAELAESLTKAVLDVEVGSDNEVARRGIMVLFDEQSSDTWAVGGRFALDIALAWWQGATIKGRTKL